jgi:hypothetical protein
MIEVQVGVWDCTYDQAYLQDVLENHPITRLGMVPTLSHGSASLSGAIRSNALHTLFTTMDIFRLPVYAKRQVRG